MFTENELYILLTSISLNWQLATRKTIYVTCCAFEHYITIKYTTNAITAYSCIEFANSEEHTEYYLSIRCIPSTDVDVKLKEFKPILITCIYLLNSHTTTECVGKVMNAENCDKTIR